MTTELEQEFYNTFGIEPKHNDGCKLADNYWNNENLQKQYKTFDEYLNINCTESDSGLCYSTCDFAYDDLKYPDITAEKLIQIFLLLNQWYDWRYGVDIEAENVEDFKKEVLQKCIDTYNKGWVAYNGFEPKNIGLYEDIQQLFKD